MEREISKRNLHVATISFGGPVNDPSQHKAGCCESSRSNEVSAGIRRKSPGRVSPEPHKTGCKMSMPRFRAMCTGFNLIGEAAGEMGFEAGVHNHLDEMVQGPEEVDQVHGN